MLARDIANDAIGFLRGFCPMHDRAAALRFLFETDQPLIEISQHLIPNIGGAAAYGFKIVQMRNRLASCADKARLDVFERALLDFVVQAFGGVALKFERRDFHFRNFD